MKYYENEIVKIFYYPEQEVGLGVWNGKGLDDKYQDGLNNALKLIKEKKLTRWIGELTNLGVISQDNQHWTNTEWFPAALGAGLTRIAVVVSSDIFGKMSVDSIMSKVADGVYSRYFDKLEDAKKWIISEDLELA